MKDYIADIFNFKILFICLHPESMDSGFYDKTHYLARRFDSPFLVRAFVESKTSPLGITNC